MYKDKIGCYQGDCDVILGRFKRFSSYINYFSHLIAGGRGLDLGTGPGGVNGKYFSHCVLDGCDIEEAVIDSLNTEYNETFTYTLGKDKLPYQDGELDFVICSCVIQHLNNEEELKKGLEEIKRVLKKDGLFYLMFKAGTHDTTFTHFNDYYKEERTFRVFEPLKIKKMINLPVLDDELLLDENWIPYCKIVFLKNPLLGWSL